MHHIQRNIWNTKWFFSKRIYANLSSHQSRVIVSFQYHQNSTTKNLLSHNVLVARPPWNLVGWGSQWNALDRRLVSAHFSLRQQTRPCRRTKHALAHERIQVLNISANDIHQYTEACAVHANQAGGQGTTQQYVIPLATMAQSLAIDVMAVIHCSYQIKTSLSSTPPGGCSVWHSLAVSDLLWLDVFEQQLAFGRFGYTVKCRPLNKALMPTGWYDLDQTGVPSFNSKITDIMRTVCRHCGLAGFRKYFNKPNLM